MTAWSSFFILNSILIYIGFLRKRPSDKAKEQSINRSFVIRFLIYIGLLRKRPSDQLIFYN
jgi:hypothetical protein